MSYLRCLCLTQSNKVLSYVFSISFTVFISLTLLFRSTFRFNLIFAYGRWDDARLIVSHMVISLFFSNGLKDYTFPHWVTLALLSKIIDHMCMSLFLDFVLLTYMSVLMSIDVISELYTDQFFRLTKSKGWASFPHLLAEQRRNGK